LVIQLEAASVDCQTICIRISNLSSPVKGKTAVAVDIFSRNTDGDSDDLWKSLVTVVADLMYENEMREGERKYGEGRDIREEKEGRDRKREGEIGREKRDRKRREIGREER
jgi:hypothetical protein